MESAHRMPGACHRIGTILLGLLLIGVEAPAWAVDQQLTEAIQQAKVEYEPVTPAELDRQWAALASAATELERLLIPGSGRGERWKRYLRWQGVQQALTERDKPNLAALTTTLDKLKSGAAGTELPQFRRVRDAIEQTLSLAKIAQVSDQAKIINRQLDLLSNYAQRYHENPSARARFEIERRLAFFQEIGRSQQLTSMVLHQFDQPNVELLVSEHMLNQLVSESIDDTGPVTDCILGTSIRGTGWTTGRASVDLLPNSERASLVMRIEGITRSRTLGFNKPVVIRSIGTTPFTATKRIDLEDSNFWSYAATASATTSTKTLSVQKQGGGIGSRLIANTGAQRVAESKPRANYIAARHAEERIAKSLDDELLPKLQDARYEYLYRFKEPLANRQSEPKFIHFATTQDQLRVDLLEASGGQLGADTTPAPMPADYGLRVHVHETAIANALSAYLGGATLSRQSPQDDPKLNVTLPEFITDAIDKAREESGDNTMDDDQAFRPWSITFRRARPMSVEFFEQQARLVLHTAAIDTGDDIYEGWDIIAVYGLHAQNGGLMLVRMEEIDVLPTSFDPADGKGLSGRVVGLRGNLAKELNRQADAGRGFPEEISIPMLDLPEAFAEHGPLLLEDAKSQAGWLSLGWNLPE